MVASEMMMPKTLPGGGLASFLTSNMDEIDDSVLAFGRPSGINSMRDVAERMAQMGRGGDNFIVHASEREMLVPREVVENNPQLRQQIMQGIAAEGADPNAYVVGNQANSINPMTGQREFFLKKLVSGIKNVVKKVAPIVLPIVGTMVLGPIYGAAAGSALNAAIQGGNARDILRAGLTGGVVGGIGAGLQGAFQGVRAGIGALPGARAAISSAFSPSNALGGLGSRIAERGLLNAYQGPDFAALAQQQAGAQAAPLQPTMGTSSGAGGQASAAGAEGVTQPTALPGGGTGAGERSFLDRFLGTNRPTPDQFVATERARLAGLFPNLTPAQIDQQIMSAGGATMGQPNVLQRFGPTLAGGLAVGALTGAFNPVEQEAPATPGYDTTSQELLAANPELYRVGTPGAPQYLSLADIAVPTGGSSVVPPAPIMALPPLAPIRRAAAGGEMESFPRRMGAISGPGTETSDAVPAMLSDGEFVMTARAVRGAGNGDRERGVRRMYDMMRMFEGGVAR